MNSILFQSPIVTTDASMTTVDETDAVYPRTLQGWKRVDGWFAEYPPSLGMNRFIAFIILIKPII